DMPGGMGGTDLYRVAIEGDGEFGEPENLGPEINTAGNEDFPFVDSEGTLYFSSDGHLGMGGLDVFKAESRGDGFGKPENVGKDVNSRADDFSFVYYPEEKRGYVASNRAGMTEDHAIAIDNIYAVKDIIIQEIAVNTKVTDEETGEPINNASVGVYNEAGEKVDEKTSDSDGMVVFTLPGGDKKYNLQASAADYEPAAKEVPHQLDGNIDVDITLKPVVIAEEEIEVETIHFDFDKYNVKKEAAFELDKIYDILKKYPAMNLEIIGHTDNIGSAEYNQKLSERRAESAAKYLMEKGIDESRIETSGKGLTDPKIDCTDCTDEERAINRRDEFKFSIN
ncbi:MAG TPA: OmpA family protein, partial [Flavobacteriaceae bacterium]|nr:OmpA family protein [Flavobacteriaceae bacterium]